MNIKAGIYDPIPSSYSKEIRNLIDNMLHKNPKRRYKASKVLSIV